jgi:hypothetical protein
MPDFIEQLRRRLVELGCPFAQVGRLVREVADHREDLMQDGLTEGLSGMDAKVRAEARLGDPKSLAKDLMQALRHGSWWSRHYLIGFCLLPLVSVPVLWALLLCLDLSVEFALGYGWDDKKLHAAADNPVTFHHLVMALQGTDYLAMALVTLFFCWLARRSAVSFRWMVTACVICSIYSLFIYAHLQPHSFVFGMSWRPQWIRAAIPLMVVGFIYAVQKRNTYVALRHQ